MCLKLHSCLYLSCFWWQALLLLQHSNMFVPCNVYELIFCIKFMDGTDVYVAHLLLLCMAPIIHSICGFRSSRSRERGGAVGEPEGKRELKDLHSTFAKAQAETLLPDKADHLIMPPQRVDTAFPHAPSHRYLNPT